MSGGYTVIQYDDISLYQVTTEDVTQVPVFDESGTDLLYVKTTIKVSGFIHGHNGSIRSEDGGQWTYQTNNDGTGQVYGGKASLAEIQVRRRLEPRGHFIMTMGCSGQGQLPDGTPLFDVQPMPTDLVIPSVRVPGNITLVGYDLNNGPKNLDFTITQLTGDELYRVKATFEICHLECAYDGSNSQNNLGVLSNRWSCVDSLDNNLQVTRTYNGQLVVATQNINAQSFRWMTVPTLQPLFRIEAMDFQVSADGLILNWTVVHKEIASAAPWPARTWNVVHTENRSMGLKGSASIDVELTGDSQVDKGRLITLAYWIIFAKMFGKSPANIAALSNEVDRQAPPGSTPQSRYLSQFVIKDINFTDYIGDVNRITAHATIQRQSEIQQNDITIAFGNLGTAILGDALPPPQGTEPFYRQYYSWGAYAGQTPEFEGPAKLAGIFACFLQTPCDNDHSLFVAAGNTSPSLSYAADAPFPLMPPPESPSPVISSVTVVDTIDQFPSYYSAGQDAALYTFWQIDNLYETNAMMIQMPIANSIPLAYGAVNQVPTCSIVAVAQGQATRTLRVSAERIGQEPELPNINDKSKFPSFITPGNYSPGQSVGPDPTIVQTLLHTKLKPGTPMVTALGQLLFRADAEYVIALSRYPNPGEQLALGNDKWNSFGNQNSNPNGSLTNSSWMP